MTNTEKRVKKETLKLLDEVKVIFASIYMYMTLHPGALDQQVELNTLLVKKQVEDTLKMYGLVQNDLREIEADKRREFWGKMIKKTDKLFVVHDTMLSERIKEGKDEKN